MLVLGLVLRGVTGLGNLGNNPGTIRTGGVNPSTGLVECANYALAGLGDVLGRYGVPCLHDGDVRTTPTEEEEMKVRPDFFRPRAFWIVDGDVVNGYVDLDDPENLDLEYTKVIASVLEIMDYGNVVHVGGGGLECSPATYSPSARSVLQTVFEPDMDMIEFIGQTLKTLEGFNVVNMTGEEGIAKLPDGFTDLTIVDGFVNGIVPQELLSERFFADLYRTSNTVIFNTIQQMPIQIPDAPYGNRLMLAPEMVIQGKERANVLFMWSKDPLPVEKIQLNLPSSYRVTDFNYGRAVHA